MFGVNTLIYIRIKNKSTSCSQKENKKCFENEVIISDLKLSTKKWIEILPLVISIAINIIININVLQI
jgi:hypothetical protein